MKSHPLDATFAEPSPAPDIGASYRLCRVIASSRRNWIVQEQGRTWRVHRATSCLLQPQIGDRVACLFDQTAEQGWLLAVLERKHRGAALQLSVEGDLELAVGGRWQVRTAELDVEADSAQLKTNEARMRFDTLKLVGRVMQNTVQQVRWVGQELVAVVDRWVQHAKSHQRHTEGMEQVCAGHMEMQARGLMHVKAPHVLTEGGELVKTRGSQIHFG